MENQTSTEKTFKDSNIAFIQMMGDAMGVDSENPNFDKVQYVLDLLTEMGTKNPAFVRKIFSPSMMELIANVATKMVGMSETESGLFALGNISSFVKTYKNA